MVLRAFSCALLRVSSSCSFAPQVNWRTLTMMGSDGSSFSRDALMTVELQATSSSVEIHKSYGSNCYNINTKLYEAEILIT